MKKHLLLAALACMGMSAYAETYYCGKNVATPEELTSGKYFLYSYTKGAGRFLHNDATYGAAQGLNEITTEGITDGSYIYDITVSESHGLKTFTIKTNEHGYFGTLGTGDRGKGNITTANLLQEGTDTDNNHIAMYTITDTYMGRPTDGFYGRLYNLQLVNETFGGGDSHSYLTSNGDSNAAHLSYWNGNGAVVPANSSSHFTGIALFKVSETPAPTMTIASESAMPTESGWYVIQHISSNDWLVNAQEEYFQTNKQSYPVTFANGDFFSNQPSPALGLFYVTVSGTTYNIKSTNGHIVNSKSLAAYSSSNPPSLTGNYNAGFTSTNNGIKIGNFWVKWNFGTQSNPNNYAGGSGNGTDTYRIFKSEPEQTFDIWTVTIENETTQLTPKYNVQLALKNKENYGLYSVYNNGNFFLPKGTTISPNDLELILNDDHVGMGAIYTIDNENHTINASLIFMSSLIRSSLEDYKNSHIQSHLSLLTSTGIFESETLLDRLEAAYNEITIADADLNQEGLAAATAKVDAVPYNIVRETINGKKIYMACSVNDNNGEYDNIVGVSEIGSNVHHIAPTDPISIDAVWVIDFTDDTHVTLQNVVYNNYLNGLVAGTSGMEYKFDFAVANNGTFTFCNESIANNNKYLNQYPSHNLGYWTAGLSNGGSFWFITLVTPELEQGLKQSWLDLALAEPTFDGYTMGEEPGLYVRSDKYDQFIEAQNELRAAGVENFDYAKVSSVLNAEGRTPVLFDLNGLEGPALIQMAYTPAGYTFASLWSGKGFISAQNHSNGLAGTDFDHIATFVLENGRLHSLNSGIGIINGGTGPKVYEGENWSDNVNSMQVTFANVGRTDLVTPPNDDTPRHCYSIKEAGTNNTFGGSGAEGGTISWGDVAGTPAGNYAYTIWYVKNLTVDVEDGGYKLWRTPVAVNFGGNDESGAYVVSVNGTRITTTAVDGSDTYGAGTMFLLTQTVNLAVENGRHVEAPAAGLGHHAKQMHTLTAGKVYLSIHTDAVAPEAPEAEQNGYALYFDAPESKNTVTMDVVVPTEDTQKLLEAHEALIEATNANEDPLKSGTTMELALGGSSDTTQLTELTAEGRNANSVYDLQGRKLAAPAKGINIINGKKVLVK